MVTSDELKCIIEELNSMLSAELSDEAGDIVVIEEKPLENMYNHEFFYFLNGKVVVSKDALNDTYPYMNQFEIGRCLYDYIREGLARRERLKG